MPYDKMDYLNSMVKHRFLEKTLVVHASKGTCRQPTTGGRGPATCRAIASSGGGIILQPSFMVADNLERGLLVRVLPDYMSRELGIYAVYPRRKQLPLKVRCLVDFLVDAFKLAPWQLNEDL